SGPASLAPEDEARRLNVLADDYFATWVRTFPVAAMFNGVPDAPLSGLDPNAPADIQRWRAKEDRWLADLRTIRQDALTDRPEEATYGVLRETLEDAQATRVCHAELLALDQQNGWQINLGVIAQLQPLGTPERRAQALARWHAIPRYLDTELG